MTITRIALALTAAVLTAASGPCGPLLQTPQPIAERRNPTIPPDRIRVVGTVAASRSRSDLRMSASVRQQLTDSGIVAVRKAGRWASQIDAVKKACADDAAPKVDGLLFVWHDRLELFDCTTRLAAYEVSGGTEGITELADRLVAYLKAD
jgi:hypothetical protein